MKKKWLPVDSKNAARMVHLLDKDKDGTINFDEFKAFVALLPEAQVMLPQWNTAHSCCTWKSWL